ncbi:hypothetical protein ABZ801_08325 [Actinomadura sp. NPDC047616]|uniref:hypothetical protein n=1 Tax=Actinomadura sp. NPDC047616 TaxID=3155914 RepID=UPI0033C673BA
MPPTTAGRVMGVIVGVVVVQFVMLVAFAWPATRSAPRDVPIVVTGPQASAVAQRLEQQRPGAFDVRTVPDEASARTALTDRDAYAAIVTGPQGPRMLVASAASPTVAQLLQQVAQNMSPPAAPTVPVRDVVAADPDDPRGAGFGALALPLVMSSLAAAVIVTFAIRGIGRQAAAVAGIAVLGGACAAALAQGWLSVLPGSYLAVSGVMALAIAAVAGVITGLVSVMGRPGIGLGALVFMLIGNPLSAATSAPEMLPQPWGEIGQWLPPGAAATLLRSVAFFDGAGAGTPLTVLLGWILLGALLPVVGGLRGRRAETADSGRNEPALVP